MRGLVITFFWVLVFVCPVFAGNILVNGDFETGDLTGWTEGSFLSTPYWWGPPGLPPKVFSSAVPLTITRTYRDATGCPWKWTWEETGEVAYEPLPRAGFSAAYAHMGDSSDAPCCGAPFAWMSQVFEIPPGSYTLDAACDLTAFNQGEPGWMWNQLAYMMILVDDQVGAGIFTEPGNVSCLWAGYVWNHECNGGWLPVSTRDLPFTTTEGLIEVRLGMWHKAGTEPPLYGWAGFDNAFVQINGLPDGTTVRKLTNTQAATVLTCAGNPPKPRKVDSIVDNWLVNGDFETGDLTGWTVAGDCTAMPLWSGPPGLPFQVYSESQPLYVTEDYFDPAGYPWKWLWRQTSDIASEPAAKDGFSAVRTHRGPIHDRDCCGNYYSWISQTFEVPRGKYVINASADLTAFNPTFEEEPWSEAAYMQVLTDDNINACGTPDRITCGWSKYVWNQDCEGEWVRISSGPRIIFTFDGLVQVRLGAWRKYPTDASQYAWAGFDNAYFHLEPAPVAHSIDEAKKLPDDCDVDISGAIVTGIFYAADGGLLGFAIEEADRFSGIRVISDAFLSPGDIVHITGVLDTVEGERVIRAGVAEAMGTGTVPAPFSIANLDTGGGEYGFQTAVVNDATTDPPRMCVGMNNIGILMTIRGKVTAVLQENPQGVTFDDCFYVDDAYGTLSYQTGLKDGSGFPGIRCRPAPDPFWGTATMPNAGQFVEVTGVMGVRMLEESEIPIRYMWTTTFSPATVSFVQQDYPSRWNLMSISVQPQNPNPAVVFGGEDIIDGRLYAWDAPTQGLLVYDMWSPDAFGALNSSVGYWLNAAQAGTLSYAGFSEGAALLDRWVSAPKGWKIVGVPVTHNLTWADWKATDGTAMLSIQDASQHGAGWMESIGYWWDEQSQGLRDIGLPDDFPSTETMLPWHGYWIKLYKDIGLVAPAGGPDAQ